MDEQPIPEVPPAAPTGNAGWTQTPASSYPPPNGYAQAQAPPVAAAPVAGEGLSDTAAGALAYVTIIPAIIFLVMPPYNTKPFVKFHAFQCIGLAVVWFCLGLVWIVPILGWIVGALGFLALLICWILCIVKASRGSAFKLPVISEFASKQSGYRP
jgi:uncharacterized membrane protein